MTKYLVKAGDSWSGIAGSQLGDQRRFFELMRANPGRVMLQPGDEIDVPDSGTSTPTPTPFVPKGLLEAASGLPTRYGEQEPSAPVQFPTEKLDAGLVPKRSPRGFVPKFIPAPKPRTETSYRPNWGRPADRQDLARSIWATKSKGEQPSGGMKTIDPSLVAGKYDMQSAGPSLPFESLERLPIIGPVIKSATEELQMYGQAWGAVPAALVPREVFGTATLPQTPIEGPVPQGYNALPASPQGEIMTVDLDGLASYGKRVLNVLALAPATALRYTYQVYVDYPIQVMQAIATIPEKALYTGDTLTRPTLEQLAILASPASANMLSTSTGKTRIQMYEEALARRDDFSRFIHNDDGSINWARLIGEPIIDFRGTDTIEKMMNATGIAGIGFSLTLHPDRQAKFIQSVERGELTVAEATSEYQDFWVELIGQSLTDPLNTAAAASVMKHIFPLGDKLISLATDYQVAQTRLAVAAGVVAKIQRTAPEIVANVVDNRTLTDKVTSWLLMQSKKSLVTKYSGYASDALHTFALRIRTEPAGAIASFERLFLEAAEEAGGPLLHELGPIQQTVIRSVASTFKEHGLSTVEDILQKYGAFARGTVKFGDVSIVADLIKDANDPLRIADYLRTGFVDLYAREIGFKGRRVGSLSRMLDFTTGLYKEMLLAVNVAYIVMNVSANTLYSILSGYSASPFDFPTSMKLMDWSSAWGTTIPDTVLHGFLAEALGFAEDVHPKMASVPLLGIPSEYTETLTGLTGLPFADWYKQSWLSGNSLVAKMYQNVNLGTLFKYGKGVITFTEMAARANIFFQAFDSKIESVARPALVSALRSMNASSELIDAASNPSFVRSPESLERWIAPYLAKKRPSVNIAAYPYSSKGPVSNQLLGQMAQELEKLQLKYGDDVGKLGLRVDDLFAQSDRAAEKLMKDGLEALQNANLTADETLVKAILGPIEKEVQNRALPDAEQILNEMLSVPMDVAETPRASVFARRLKGNQEAERGALDNATIAVTNSGRPEAVQNFVAAVKELQDSSSLTSGVVRDLRERTLTAYRRLQAARDRGTITPDEYRLQAQSIWEHYFAFSDSEWQAYFDVAAQRYDEVVSKYGPAGAGLPEIPPSDVSTATLPEDWEGGIQWPKQSETKGLGFGGGAGDAKPVTSWDEIYKNAPETTEFFSDTDEFSIDIYNPEHMKKWLVSGSNNVSVGMSHKYFDVVRGDDLFAKLETGGLGFESETIDNYLIGMNDIISSDLDTGMIDTLASEVMRTLRPKGRVILSDRISEMETTFQWNEVWVTRVIELLEGMGMERKHGAVVRTVLGDDKVTGYVRTWVLELVNRKKPAELGWYLNEPGVVRGVVDRRNIEGGMLVGLNFDEAHRNINKAKNYVLITRPRDSDTLYVTRMGSGYTPRTDAPRIDEVETYANDVLHLEMDNGVWIGETGRANDWEGRASYRLPTERNEYGIVSLSNATPATVIDNVRAFLDGGLSPETALIVYSHPNYDVEEYSGTIKDFLAGDVTASDILPLGNENVMLVSFEDDTADWDTHLSSTTIADLKNKVQVESTRLKGVRADDGNWYFSDSDTLHHGDIAKAAGIYPEAYVVIVPPRRGKASVPTIEMYFNSDADVGAFALSTEIRRFVNAGLIEPTWLLEGQVARSLDSIENVTVQDLLKQKSWYSAAKEAEQALELTPEQIQNIAKVLVSQQGLDPNTMIDGAGLSGWAGDWVKKIPAPQPQYDEVMERLAHRDGITHRVPVGTKKGASARALRMWLSEPGHEFIMAVMDDDNVLYSDELLMHLPMILKNGYEGGYTQALALLSRTARGEWAIGGSEKGVSRALIHLIYSGVPLETRIRVTEWARTMMSVEGSGQAPASRYAITTIHDYQTGITVWAGADPTVIPASVPSPGLRYKEPEQFMKSYPGDKTKFRVFDPTKQGVQDLGSQGFGGGDEPVWDDAVRQRRNAGTSRMNEEWENWKQQRNTWYDSVKSKLRYAGDFTEQNDAEIARLRTGFDKVKRLWNEEIEKATLYGAAETLRVLFDYLFLSNWEELLRYYSPFSTWQIRNPQFWAQTFLQKPGLMNLWWRYNKLSEGERQRLNLTGRFKGTAPLPFQQGLQDAGFLQKGYYGLDLAGSIGPGSQFQSPMSAFGAEGPENDIQAIAQAIFTSPDWMGIRPYPVWEALEEKLGVRPPGYRTEIFGPLQRVPGIEGALDALQAFLGLEGHSTEALTEYLVKRRIAEMIAEGLIPYSVGYSAKSNPSDPVYQEALQYITTNADIMRLIRSFVPVSTKFASQGEVNIRESLQVPASERYTGEYQQYDTRPQVTAYRKLFQSHAETEYEAEVYRINTKYDALLQDVSPTDPEYTKLQSARVQELAALASYSGPEKSFAQSPTYRGSKRTALLMKLEDLEPKPQDFTTYDQNVDWDAYNEALDEFVLDIPVASKELGLRVSISEYQRFRNRYKSGEELAAQVDQRRGSQGFDLQASLYDATSPEFQLASRKFLTEQIENDVASGTMTLEQASRRAKQTAQTLQQKGLPYDFIQNKLQDFGPKVGTALLTQDEKLDQATRLAPRTTMFLPGMAKGATYEQGMRRVLSNFYYDSTSVMKRKLELLLGLDSGENFARYVKGLSYDEVQRALTEVQQSAYGERGSRELRTIMRDYAYSQSSVGDGELINAQLARDFFKYEEAQQQYETGKGSRPEWTPLMETYAGNPGSGKAQFWNEANSLIFKSEAFDDPVIAAFMDKGARSMLDFTDRQYQKALDYMRNNRTSLVDEELTADAISHPEWFQTAQTQRDEIAKLRDAELDALRLEYYQLDFDARDEWEDDNPEDYKRIQEYDKVLDKIFQSNPYYTYFYRHSDYTDFFGDSPPDAPILLPQKQTGKVDYQWTRALATQDLELARREHPEWYREALNQSVQLKDFRDPEIERLRSEYYAMGTEQRKAWREANPDVYNRSLKKYSYQI